MYFSIFNDNNNNNMNNFDSMKTKIVNYQSQLPGLFEDFKKYYIFSHKNPEYTEYSNMLEEVKKNLADISTSLLKMNTQVQSSTNDLTSNLDELYDKINQYRETHTHISAEMKNIADIQNTSTILINDYVTIYNMNYLKNTSMLLGILIVIVLHHNLSKKNTYNNTTTTPTNNSDNSIKSKPESK